MVVASTPHPECIQLILLLPSLLSRLPVLGLVQVVDVIHPGRAPVSKKDVVAHVAKLHKADAKNVVTFGFKTAFGG
jgi:hypothetical protein